MSAGVLSGAGVAVADTGSAPSSEAGASGASSGSESGPAKTETSTDPKAAEPGAKTEGQTTSGSAPDTTAAQADHPKKKKKKPATSSAASTAKPATERKTEPAAAPSESTAAKLSAATSEPAKSAVAAATPAVKTALRLAEEPVTAKAAPTAAVNPVKVIAKAVTSLVNRVGSVAINALQALEKLLAGPPVLPAKSTVTVRTSTILLGNGQRVQANWYFPDGDEPPEKMILLQHGFLALGPMYSYTAANLAERTHSVVVTPTLTSNFFAGDDHWLGGTGMAEEIANLFTGNRDALTQSAIDAGYATRYGLDPETVALPEKFALAGHSLGGSLVSGAAGFLATNGAADNLVGVILLDAVPSEGTLETALTKLAAYADSPGGHYIPVREIGAPKNAWNAPSTVNEALTAARPDQFNGVILSGGVHMDSMQGGNPVIQFFAFLLAGFPKAQNPPAVQNLSVDWLTAWFDGTDEGPAPVPGSIIDIDTPKGTAHGRVIGTQSPSTATAIPAAATTSTASIISA